jgi:hypothetical protein
MAENIPTSPGGALPPKPAEASKVQPKKETVRINLPPKPTSAPTIKLPTLAPGVPASAGAAAPAAAAPATAASRAPAPPTPPAGAPATRIAAPTPARPTTAPAAPRPMAPMAAGLSGLDKGLAIAAAIASLAALGCVLYLAFWLKDPNAALN